MKASFAVISPVDGFFPRAVRRRRCRFISSTKACMQAPESLHGLAFQIAFTCSRTMTSVRPKRYYNNSMALELCIPSTAARASPDKLDSKYENFEASSKSVRLWTHP
ncbi:hypothetical protein T09_8349 [Trichinella sp. T9]|nr:hypothetical protein T09_8349 [Trichinella sp. T9]